VSSRQTAQRNRRQTVLRAGFIFWAVGLVSAARGVQANGVNWETAHLEVIGRGICTVPGADPQACFATATQQARRDVEQQLLKQVLALQVDSAHTGATLLQGSEEQRTAVTDLCKNYTITQTTYFADSRVTLAATLPLYAGVAQALLGEPAALAQAGVSESSADSAEPEGLLPTLTVVVRGQSVQPSLAPRLCGPRGQDLLAANVRASALQLQVRFTQSRTAAPTDSGGLRSSLQVEGRPAPPPRCTDVLLSADDAREVIKFLQLLKDSADEVRVVFILT
jgi:hypothetical protein